MTPPMSNIVILGAGSAGERLATLVADDGHDVTVVEDRLVGGECPFFACIPSKSMLLQAATRATIREADQELAEDAQAVLRPGPDAFADAASRRDEAADHHDDSAHEKNLLQAGVTLVRGRGKVASPSRLVVTTDDGEQQIDYDQLVLATGTSPVIPDLDGLADSDPWTFEGAWTATELPGSMLIMGAGPVGCEIAQTYVRFGSRVTLVDQKAVLGGKEEPEIAEDLRAVLEADGITVLEQAEVTRVEQNDDDRSVVHVSMQDGEEQQVVVDRVVVAVGMKPNLDVGLDVFGVDPKDFAVDDHCRVQGAENLWAIGDVTGKAPFTHGANYQARIVAKNLTGTDATADYRSMPRAVYTSPQMGATGLTRSQAEAQGIDVVSVVFDLDDTARGAVDDDDAGRLVLVADRGDGVLIGASGIGPAVAESISEFSLAILTRTPVSTLTQVIHPFPTWSEGFGPAIQDLADALS